MTSFDTGRHAEQVAAQYLARKGFRIFAQNWRTRWCEIDVITGKNRVIYFVEVKYRKTSVSGRGIDYITSNKLQQMARAAESWVQRHNWHGDYRLAIVELSGSNFSVDDFIILT